MHSPYLERARDASALLLQDVVGLDDEAVAAPSLLPGWDRAMLLTHLAANADGVRRAVEAATAGRVGEVYVGGADGRAAEIEAGKGASAAGLLARLTGAVGQLDDVLRHAPDEVWRARALSHRGEVEIGPGLIVGRLREVMVHHVDLLVGYKPQDWPLAWVMEEMDRSMLDLPLRLPPGVAVVMEATDIGQRWVAGSGDQVDISATTAELFAWVAGRAAGVPAQACPQLGPWR